MKVAAYLNFNLNAKEAIETYKSLFGAELGFEVLFTEETTNNPALVGKVYHAELKIGNLNLYLTDRGTPPSFKSIGFVLEIDDEDEARNYLAKIAQNGKLVSGFKKNPVGPTIGSAEDQFGISWDVVIV